MSAEDEDGDISTVVPIVTPMFSMLPRGPLEHAVMFLRESDVGQLLQTSKDILCSSAVDSEEFWRERCYHTFGRHLQCIESLGKGAFHAFLQGLRHSLDGNSWGRDVWLEDSNQLLLRCVGVSSQDRDDEAPRHTLTVSSCAALLCLDENPPAAYGARTQITCGCAWANKCYWSSHPSPVSDKDEWIEYDTERGVAMLSSFVITPYTSFWQPDQPTYNPVEVCIQLIHPDVNQGKPYYESPRFRVKASMTHQKFKLPKPVLCLGGWVKVLLKGMAQRQTLGEDVGDTANHYHVCISHVALCGTLLLSCSLQRSADGYKKHPRNGWLVEGDWGGFEMPADVGDGKLKPGVSVTREAVVTTGGQNALNKLRISVDEASLHGTHAPNMWCKGGVAEDQERAAPKNGDTRAKIWS